MNDKFDGNDESLRKRDEFYEDQSAPRQRIRVNLDANGSPHNNGQSASSTFTFWTVLDLLARRWGWLCFGGLLGTGALLLVGMHFIKAKYTASAQLMRYENPTAKEFFYKETPMSAETFAGLIRSPELLRRVGLTLQPPVESEKFGKFLKVDPEPDSDLVKVLLLARDPQVAVDLLNRYLEEAVNFTKEFQQEQARSVADVYLKSQVDQMAQELEALYREFRGFPAAAQLTNKLNQVSASVNALTNTVATAGGSSMFVQMQSERLRTAIAELADLTQKFTDLHPQVQAKRSLVADLQKSLTQASTNTHSAVAYPPIVAARPAEAFNPDLDIIRTKLHSLEDAHVQLINKQREAQLFATNAPGMARISAPATLKSVHTNMRWFKVSVVAVFGGVVGTCASLLLVMFVELTDKRLKTAEDVRRVTKLPVLTGLGDLERMAPEDRSLWAFRAWTMLQGRLSRSANHGLVCGITSCSNGEGRSTWIRLLAEAASLTGFRVLTIATRPSATPGDFEEQDPGQLLDGGVEANDVEPADPAYSNSAALSSNVLTSPAKVTEKLTGPNSQPMVHIPLPGWVWDLDRRKQWREALMHWRTIENLVILVELPPAGVPEAVLLGSNLPNLIWLADRNGADAAETRAQLETLRHARCNLVGAVLNRGFSRSFKNRFPRWLECSALVMALAATVVRAQDSNLAPPAQNPVAAPVPPDQGPASTNAFFSIVNPSQRAAWQQHLTLGPGDVLTFALFEHPELTRPEVVIAPDGRVNFLEAQDVLATGLTIDELRAKLDEEIGKYRRAPRTMITPVAFRSKKYFMLGKVMTKGMYILDRPLTVLEAIARAHGLENGLVDRNIIDLADFQRSFLVRGGKRISLDFEKLFQAGDLSQNLAIEPGDYLYFPSSSVKEVYVVGEVRLPGPVNFNPNTTIMAAIAARGGYTDRAFKMRVLVVRGSLNNPETFAVDTHAILDARAPDFQLQARDIIYVNSRPFIKVEELADLAATAFIQSLISSWVGVDVVKPIQGSP